MLPLQHARLWRALSTALVLLVLAAALAPNWWFDTRAQALAWFEHADKWLHGITFLCFPESSRDRCGGVWCSASCCSVWLLKAASC